MTNEDFTQAVKRNNQRIYLIAFSFTKSRTDAEDILQNVFLKLWKYPKSFESQKNLDLFNAVMSLPKKERAVIHLFYYEDMTVKEIAEMLKIKESAVKTRLHRARKTLKLILGDEWINE